MIESEDGQLSENTVGLMSCSLEKDYGVDRSLLPMFIYSAKNEEKITKLALEMAERSLVADAYRKYEKSVSRRRFGEG